MSARTVVGQVFTGGGEVRLPGSSDTDRDRWRVFISHTSELQKFPKAKPYVDMVKGAVSAAGHVIVDMADFPAADKPPAQLCAERVRGCEVYVGVLGTRYGSPVRERPQVSYTELEFDTATEEGLDRLVFLLNTDVEDVGIPASALIDREFGARQDAFRRRVQESKLVTQSFANPAELGHLVERSLRDLAETRKRIGSGIQREQAPAKPQSVRASRFVNPPPAEVPAWFQDRHVETGLLVRHLTDPGIRLVTVLGRGGIGKTAMVCLLLKGLEADWIPDIGSPTASRLGRLPSDTMPFRHQMTPPGNIVASGYDFAGKFLATQRNFTKALLDATAPLMPGYHHGPGAESAAKSESESDLAKITVGGIVYLSSKGLHQVEYPALVADLLRLLPADATRRLRRLYRQCGPGEMMLALLEAFPAGAPVVVLLDNLESVLDAERETLREQALHEALVAVLTAPAHAVTVIVTTRVMPAELVKIEPARQRQLRLDKGLDSPDAQTVLRALDDDGRLGLRDAPENLLDDLRRHTRGFPRALEAVKAILDGDHTLTPRDLLDRTRRLPEDQVVQVLVGDAYELLDLPAQQVMQALAIYPVPVSAVGVDFLLRPVNPTTNAEPILTRLVNRQLARFRDGYYYLHPVDREYACSRLRPGRPGDSPAAFTLVGLQARAADYYALIRTPPESWRTLEDIRPQLAEFELRCDIGDYDTAATVLANVDSGCLLVWGHYRTLVELHGRIHGRIADPAKNSIHLTNLANCYASLGDYRQAENLYTQALAIARDTSDRRLEGGALLSLGLYHASVGDSRRAVDLHTQALAIFRDIGDRRLEGGALASLGLWRTFLGDIQEAVDLSSQALAIARDIGDRRLEGAALVSLGLCRARSGEFRRAGDLYTQALAIARDTSDRRLEGAALVSLGLRDTFLGEYRRAEDLYTQALAIARDTSDRRLEGGALGSLGACHLRLGEYRQAEDLHTQALAIARSIGDRQLESHQLANLANCRLALGDHRQAVHLDTEALAIADDIGDTEPAAKARSGLARAYLQLGDPAAALAAVTRDQVPPYPTEEPTMRLLEGLSLLELHRIDEAVRAFGDSVTAADMLLALADGNIAALQVRPLGLSGLAVVTGNPARATEAGEAFTTAHAVTDAAGVAEDTRRLLNAIASHDQSGILALIHAAPDPYGHQP